MPYPEMLVAPMRQQLENVGFKSLMTANEVEQELADNVGTKLLVFNSVCGCAAANARPAARISTQNEKHPDRFITVFAGMEKEAVDTARAHMLPYPPSSPAIALFKDGKLVHMIERHQIEGRPAQMIADNLSQAFDQYC